MIEKPKCQVPGCTNNAATKRQGKYYRLCERHRKEKYRLPPSDKTGCANPTGLCMRAGCGNAVLGMRQLCEEHRAKNNSDGRKRTKEKHKDKYLAHERQQYRNNPHRRIRNKGHLQRWKEANPERYKVSQQRWRQVQKEKRQQPCSLCAWHEAGCDLHRIVPGEHGGTYKAGNVLLICPNCHRLAHDDPKRFWNKLTTAALTGHLAGENLLLVADSLARAFRLFFLQV